MRGMNVADSKLCAAHAVLKAAQTLPVQPISPQTFFLIGHQQDPHTQSLASCRSLPGMPPKDAPMHPLASNNSHAFSFAEP